ncbi:MAG: hypothetical protein U1D55_09315 [Phycisphaerae bacterium]
MSDGDPRKPAAAAARWRELRERAGGSTARALRFVVEYVALRMWELIVGCFPIEANRLTARWMARIWWRIDKRHRELALTHLRFALGADHDEAALRRIARGSFEHLAQLYLVEVPLEPRLITRWAWARYVHLGDLERSPPDAQIRRRDRIDSPRDTRARGDALETPSLSAALRVLLAGRGAILVTPHFGNYELVGFALARLGLPLHAIMRPPDNPLLDAYVRRTREQSGLSLIMKRGAGTEADDVLARGGTLAFIADQDAGKKGVFADFFGRAAAWYKSIPLLAMRHHVPLIIGGAYRLTTRFRYELHVERIIEPHEWALQDDPLLWITGQISNACESLIRRAPEQYLWIHRRWKTRPRTELATREKESAARLA